MLKYCQEMVLTKLCDYIFSILNCTGSILPNNQ
jgi:hypothetical protein